MTQNTIQETRAKPATSPRRATPSKAARPSAVNTSKASKAATVIALLSRPEGATIEALTSATGWQTHSVRGFLSGTVKTKLGKLITSEKTEAGRTYRLVESSAA